MRRGTVRGEMADWPACLGSQRGNSRVHHCCESFMLNGFRTLIGPRPGARATLAHGSRHDPISGPAQVRSKLQHGSLLCPGDRAEPVWGCDPDPGVGPDWSTRTAKGRALRKPVMCSGSPRSMAPAKAATRLSSTKRVGEGSQGNLDCTQRRILSNSSTASASLRLPLSCWRSTSLIWARFERELPACSS
jgi:hypothetical protein